MCGKSVAGNIVAMLSGCSKAKRLECLLAVRESSWVRISARFPGGPFAELIAMRKNNFFLQM